jgi:hypothetical protein
MATARISVILILLVATVSTSFAKKSRKQSGALVPWKSVPASVQTTLQSTAGSGKVKEVQKIAAANGVVFYCGEVKGSDGKWTKVYVNEAGALIKSEPDNARNKRKHRPLFG